VLGLAFNRLHAYIFMIIALGGRAVAEKKRAFQKGDIRFHKYFLITFIKVGASLLWPGSAWHRKQWGDERKPCRRGCVYCSGRSSSGERVYGGRTRNYAYTRYSCSRSGSEKLPANESAQFLVLVVLFRSLSRWARINRLLSAYRFLFP
jgi:hypothetical protein